MLVLTFTLPSSKNVIYHKLTNAVSRSYGSNKTLKPKFIRCLCCTISWRRGWKVNCHVIVAYLNL